jgi:ABC-2 type transport system ATP-binding protein
VPAIRIEGLHKAFGNVKALDGLSLAVEEGSIFGFLGPNGAGKTTTIRILTGLARATAGRAWLDGIDVTRDHKQVSRRIGYLPQDPSFYSWMTAAEMLDHVGRIFGLAAGERRERTGQLLELAGLTVVAGRRIGGYSGGMRQRLGIAQALVNQPSILFLDEPVSSLDPAGRRELLRLIEDLRDRCTVFMSTHILADVERVCDTIGIIHQGKLVIQSSKQALLQRYAVPAFDLETEIDQATQLTAWAAQVESWNWVASVAVQGPVAHVVVNDLDTAKRELASAALQAGLTLTRYEMIRPSLEDVFLKLVETGSE